MIVTLFHASRRTATGCSGLRCMFSKSIGDTAKLRPHSRGLNFQHKNAKLPCPGRLTRFHPLLSLEDAFHITVWPHGSGVYGTCDCVTLLSAFVFASSDRT